MLIILVSSQMNLVFVFLADDTAGRDRKHHTKDFDDLPTKAQNKHGQIFAMEWTRRFGGTQMVPLNHTTTLTLLFKMERNMYLDYYWHSTYLI